MVKVGHKTAKGSCYFFGNLPPLLMHSAIVANGVKFSVLPQLPKLLWWRLHDDAFADICFAFYG